eukprot:CAMPEP_0169428580 /NCGR_PEP_ID=MMETSP1042-20121227/1404_1 /TAXON_ID=464988 /ORGANISM="Hemiselmis andersenii, Strain CCMP1180" /LENGTH=91 /DNA_ID=CAMNT_0009538763 /DNA_START=419 /DNA_END=692 /DNA_ORIENTATION=-
MSSSLIHLLLFGLRAPPPGEAWPVPAAAGPGAAFPASHSCSGPASPAGCPADPGGARREAERADAGRDCCGGAEAWDRRDAAEEGRGGPPA